MIGRHHRLDVLFRVAWQPIVALRVSRALRGDLIGQSRSCGLVAMPSKGTTPNNDNGNASHDQDAVAPASTNSMRGFFLLSQSRIFRLKLSELGRAVLIPGELRQIGQVALQIARRRGRLSAGQTLTIGGIVVCGLLLLGRRCRFRRRSCLRLFHQGELGFGILEAGDLLEARRGSG